MFKQLYESRFSSTTAPTTTLNYAYTSYRMTIPQKFKQCKPIPTENFTSINGTIVKGLPIPPDTCLVVNASCCPACDTEFIDGSWHTYGYGGRIDTINEKYYKNGNSTEPDYYTDYLHNCSGFGVVCRMASSPTGCHYSAECVNGLCQLVSRT
jgi:hypothetical protein